MTALLQVRDLHVHFPTAEGLARAVDGVSFALDRGSSIGLVGESGCGKSTTAWALLRLLPAGTQLSGSVLFEGVSLLDVPEAKLLGIRGSGMALIGQNPAASLNPLYSLGSQVAEVVRVHQRLSRRGALVAALALLREVQLGDGQRVARQYPHEVSGGMQQRVVIAMALAGRPRLLLADEPTSSLDRTVQAEILSLLRRLRAQHQMALFLISHDLDVIAAMTETVAVMYAGKIVEHGPVSAVFGQPLHPYTAGLLQCRPRPGETGRLKTIEGVVPALTKLPVGCRFRERCMYRDDRCHIEPPLEEKEASHSAACWRSLEVFRTSSSASR